MTFTISRTLWRIALVVGGVVLIAGCSGQSVVESSSTSVAPSTSSTVAPPTTTPATMTPTTPTNVIAKPGVATVKISWDSPHKTGVTYTVTSVPAGVSCVVVGLATCTLPVTVSTPWRYQVAASIGQLRSTASALTPVVPHRTLVVLAGQSNATGARSYAVDPKTRVNYLAAPYANGADATSTVSWLPWGVYPVKGHRAAQVALDTPQLWVVSTGKPDQIFGPEIGWARQLWADIGQPVSVIKAASPGSPISLWRPSTRGGLFSQMMANIRSTMAADARHGQLDTIGAVAWYQGESDAVSPTAAAHYRAKLRAFIRGLRSHLPANPTIPIVLVKESLASLLSSWKASGSCGENCRAVAAGDAKVRAADDWAAANLAHVVEVDTLGLPRFRGAIHLTNTSELAIGREIGTASDRLMP